MTSFSLHICPCAKGSTGTYHTHMLWGLCHPWPPSGSTPVQLYTKKIKNSKVKFVTNYLVQKVKEN